MPENILKASCTSARHAGSFDCLMASLILITMDNGRGHCAWWQSCTAPNQTHRGNKKKRKMYAIKQIKICAEYRDMLPRPRLDLSGTPGLRPIGLSPGSWQTSLGLGSMSRYSAQILICITKVSYSDRPADTSWWSQNIHMLSFAFWVVFLFCFFKSRNLCLKILIDSDILKFSRLEFHAFSVPYGTCRSQAWRAWRPCTPLFNSVFTCQNLQFWQVCLFNGVSVCLSVCLSVCPYVTP